MSSTIITRFSTKETQLTAAKAYAMLYLEGNEVRMTIQDILDEIDRTRFRLLVEAHTANEQVDRERALVLLYEEYISEVLKQWDVERKKAA